MSAFGVLIKRNTKLFFKDKGMFLTSLITPVILLVLYITFLADVYRDSFMLAMPAGLKFKEELIDGCVAGQLISSILAVSCVTVAFCSNMLMVQDKANGSIKDFKISPIGSPILALGYYISSLISTLLIAFSATAICLVYVSFVGWYMSLADVLLLFLDVFLLVMFGTALSSIINFFLKTQGQISAVGTMVSSGYGFICGAYMPISQFSEGLQRVISLLPGTYGTSLIRNHAMGGVFAEMAEAGYPKEVITELKDVVDCNLYFFDNKISVLNMFMVLLITVLLLVTVYVLMNIIRERKIRKTV